VPNSTIKKRAPTIANSTIAAPYWFFMVAS
jgi:hypothetical protein